jgi:HEAT repeat protein
MLYYLGQLKARQSVPSILALFSADSLQKAHASVRLAAIRALGLIQDARALPVLRAALQDKAPQVRDEARQALELLGELGDDRFKKRP